MAKRILVDEILLLLFVPGDLDRREGRRIRKTLSSARFQSNFRVALRDLFRKHPSLKRLRCVVSA